LVKKAESNNGKKEVEIVMIVPYGELLPEQKEDLQRVGIVIIGDGDLDRKIGRHGGWKLIATVPAEELVERIKMAIKAFSGGE